MSSSDGLVQLLASVISGGGVGAIASWLTARIRARSEVHQADTGLAATVVEAEIERNRALWNRVDTLERRCDERDAHIDQLEKHASRCDETLVETQRVALEREQRYAQLEVELARMREQLARAAAEGGA